MRAVGPLGLLSRALYRRKLLSLMFQCFTMWAESFEVGFILVSLHVNKPHEGPVPFGLLSGIMYRRKLLSVEFLSIPECNCSIKRRKFLFFLHMSFTILDGPLRAGV